MARAPSSGWREVYEQLAVPVDGHTDDPAKTGEVSQVRDVPARAVVTATSPYRHRAMTADDSTPEEWEYVSEVSLEDYSGRGTAHATGEHFHGEFRKADAEVMLQTVGDGCVSLSAIYENEPAAVEVMVQLEPRAARQLGAELIEWAGRMETEGGDRNASRPDA